MDGKILICPNPYRDIGCAMAERIKDLLRNIDREAEIVPVFVGDEGGNSGADLGRAAGSSSLIVAIGGDGTFLHVARLVKGTNIPLIGVNMGNKGFLAGLEPDQTELIMEAAKGRFAPSRRMMLDVALERADGSRYTDCALNDVVLKSDVNAIGLSVFSGGVMMTEYSGDGVIIATPTGSTAYSMSAGGPIVEPEAQNIIVTPICAHDLAVRSFVLSPERTVVVKPDKIYARRAMLAVDGSAPVDLNAGDSIIVSRSENSIVVADMGISSFYDMTREKLTHSK